MKLPANIDRLPTPEEKAQERELVMSTPLPGVHPDRFNHQHNRQEEFNESLPAAKAGRMYELPEDARTINLALLNADLPRQLEAGSSGGPTIPVDTAPSAIQILSNPKIREFSTGATRDTDEGKFDYEGFLSVRVLERYAAYMHKHRVQSDGSVRDSDNWQKGIPVKQYMKSLWRHFIDVWGTYRELDKTQLRTEVLEDALCALLFNAMGMLHEVLNGRS